jgi:SAM-dependent methyltransferase
MISEVSSILNVCGIGSYLQIGNLDQPIVFELLKHSLDAHGMDHSVDIIDKNCQKAPGRFITGTITQPPFEMQSYDTIVIGSDLLTAHTDDLISAFKSLYQMTRHNLVIIDTGAAARSFLEELAIKAGFRRHKRSMIMTSSYASLENDNIYKLMFFERYAEILSENCIPILNEISPAYPDRLSQSGHRSDAHIWQYMLAIEQIKLDDTVLDTACGSGYGTALLAANTTANHYIGVDINPASITYAQNVYAKQNPNLNYQLADLTQLTFLSDHTIDVIIAFDTLAHVQDYEAFLAEARRVLKPNGRIIGSVPNLWNDNEENDASIYANHVFDWEKLKNTINNHFTLDGRWAQIAGGGFKFPFRKRSLKNMALDTFAPLDAEWWIYSAKVNPEDAYVSDLQEENESSQLTQGTKSLLPCISEKQFNAEINEEMLKFCCEQITKETNPGSADQGAALHELAYRLLESNLTSPANVTILAQHINLFNQTCDKNNSHVLRWAISLQYLSGRLLLTIGNRDDALAAFLTCSTMGAIPLTPILGSKIIAAHFYAGLILVGNNDLEGARNQFTAGITETDLIMQGDWKNLTSQYKTSLSFMLPETSEIIRIANQCIAAIAFLDKQKTSPGFFWEAINGKFFEKDDWNTIVERAQHLLIKDSEKIIT